MKHNGSIEKAPAITIFWDNESQIYEFKIDETIIKKNEMALSILEMVANHLKFHVNVQRTHEMGMQAAQQMQAQALASQLKLGRG